MILNRILRIGTFRLARNSLEVVLCAAASQFFVARAALAADAPSTQITPSKKSQAFPWDQIGAKASADYHGEGLSVAVTEEGARLRCVLQRLEGEATAEGLWLVSTVTNHPGERFRVVARAVGQQALSSRGTVRVTSQTVRFTRAGLIEEYSVSLDGVRQDFVVPERPAGDGQLKVQLAVSGARAVPATYGAQLVLQKSGRKLAYCRVRAMDAHGKELPVRIEADLDSQMALAVVVNDAGAAYPVRIDPTFSDANWVSMGGLGGADNPVLAAATDDSGNVYIGGTFKVVGNVVANQVAKWNGSSWSALGSGMAGGPPFSTVVEALAVSGSDLYAGGWFTNAGGVAANNVAKWNGTNWSALGSDFRGTEDYGLGPAIYALAIVGSNLYAGGAFTNVGGVAANNVAKWDGNGWSALGSGVDNIVEALAVSGGALYAGGWFSTAGGNAANCIAQWDGISWSALGSGMNNWVMALAVSGGTLYAGGLFTTAGDNPASSIAQWDGSSWSAPGSGMNDVVNALAASGGTLYAGGYFTAAGGHAANCIAQWNGSSWSAPGSGLNNGVSALAVSDGRLYAGGLFTAAGGQTANYIAQWDGSNWSAVGSGLNNRVTALAVSSGRLYAGGLFTTAGDTAANYIAQWDGSSWSALGSGVNGSVSALAVSGSRLYAGGFLPAGGNGANYIAQWDGSNWSALGSGMNDGVTALAVSGGTLYAGFFSGGGNPANYIAQWDGSSWSVLGSGMDGGVSALAASGGTLYAGGSFTTADGTAANYIAQWDGSSWSALGSGMNNVVNALAVSGGTLYAGGEFTTAGDKVSAFAAEATLGGTLISIITSNSSFGFTNGNSSFGFDVSGSPGQTQVVLGSADLTIWVPLQTNVLSNSLWHFSDPSTSNFRRRFYRAELQQ
jgi:hypothetical protein